MTGRSSPKPNSGGCPGPRVGGAETLGLEVFPECGELLEPPFLAEPLSKPVLRFPSHTDYCPPNGRGFKVSFSRLSRRREAVLVRAVHRGLLEQHPDELPRRGAWFGSGGYRP